MHTASDDCIENNHEYEGMVDTKIDLVYKNNDVSMNKNADMCPLSMPLQIEIHINNEAARWFKGKVFSR